jgi:membrane protein YqaA with SNARE-associated domain
MWKSVFAIALGATLGALLRWLLGLKLNSLFPTIPPRHPGSQSDRWLCDWPGHRFLLCIAKPSLAWHQNGACW